MEHHWGTTWRKTVQATHPIRETTKHVRKEPKTNRKNGKVGRRAAHGRLRTDENWEPDTAGKNWRQERWNWETQCQDTFICWSHDPFERKIKLRTQMERK